MNTPIHTHMTHEVADFNTWKPNFDNGQALRDKHGVKIHGVYQAHDNPNMVTVHAEMPGVDTMASFMNDPEAQATMREGGVIGRPEIKMLVKHA